MRTEANAFYLNPFFVIWYSCSPNIIMICCTPFYKEVIQASKQKNKRFLLSSFFWCSNADAFFCVFVFMRLHFFCFSFFTETWVFVPAYLLYSQYPLNIETSMERPLTVGPYLCGRSILGIIWVYMKAFLTKSKYRNYNVNIYRANIPCQ